eukprot:sb/3466854/
MVIWRWHRTLQLSRQTFPRHTFSRTLSSQVNLHFRRNDLESEIKIRFPNVQVVFRDPFSLLRTDILSDHPDVSRYLNREFERYEQWEFKIPATLEQFKIPETLDNHNLLGDLMSSGPFRRRLVESGDGYFQLKDGTVFATTPKDLDQTDLQAKLQETLEVLEDFSVEIQHDQPIYDGIMKAFWGRYLQTGLARFKILDNRESTVLFGHRETVNWARGIQSAIKEYKSREFKASLRKGGVGGYLTEADFETVVALATDPEFSKFGVTMVPISPSEVHLAADFEDDISIFKVINRNSRTPTYRNLREKLSIGVNMVLLKISS